MAHLSITSIEKAVCAQMNVTSAELRGPNRARQIARPRQIAMALAYELCGPNTSGPMIGKHFNRDHTTVLHARRVVPRIAAENVYFAAQLDEIRQCVVPQDWRARFISEAEACAAIANGLRGLSPVGIPAAIFTNGFTYWDLLRSSRKVCIENPCAEQSATMRSIQTVEAH